MYEEAENDTLYLFSIFFLLGAPDILLANQHTFNSVLARDYNWNLTVIQIGNVHANIKLKKHCWVISVDKLKQWTQ